MNKLRGEAVLEIRVEAVNDGPAGQFSRSNIYITVDGQSVGSTITEDQTIWNALPKKVRGLLLALCEENAEADLNPPSDNDEASDDARAP